MRNLKLASIVVTLALVLLGGLGGIGAQAEFSRDLTFNVSHNNLKKGLLLKLYKESGIECPQKDWFRGTVSELPQQGSLLILDGKSMTVITEANKATFANKLAEVVYRPFSVPSGSAMPRLDKFVLEGVPADHCNANDLNTKLFPLNVNLKITNTAPVVFNKTYSMYNGVPRSIYFRADDKDGLNDLSTLKILSITGGCTLARHPEGSKTGNLTEITTFPTIIQVPVSAYHLNFELRPPQAAIAQWIKGDPAADHCEVAYQVTDTMGASSEVGQVEVVAHDGSVRHMEAYNGVYSARPGKDTFLQVSLRTSAEGGLKDRHFYVDELPKYGKLFVRGIGGTFDNFKPHQINQTGLVDDLGRQRRSTARLYYMPPKANEIRSNTEVQIKWHFSIGLEGTAVVPKPETKSSKQAIISINLVSTDNQTGPVCGITTLDPVYLERPFIKIPWNYSLSDGSEVSRIVLYSVPTSPIGDFYATENSFQLPADTDFSSKLKPLTRGSFFNDRKQQTFFQMRDPSTFPGHKLPPLGVQQWFRIRVQNYRRQSCIGLVRVVFRKHDDKAAIDVNKTISNATTGTAIRNEVALAGKYNLLPLRGLANHSLVQNEAIKGIRISTLPTLGSLYSLDDGSPLLTKMYGTYCRKVDCASHVNSKLKLGTELGRTKFDGADEYGVELLRVLYRSNPHLTKSQMAAGDSFSYHFVGKLSEKESTWLQKVYITFREGYNKALYFTYDKPIKVPSDSDAKNNTGASHAQQVYAGFKISNMSAVPGGQVVEVIESDDFKHHYIKKKKFHLFQLKTMDGHRAVPDKEIGPSKPLWDTSNVARRWIKDPENRLVFAPSLSTHRQRFSFRVKIYPLDERGILVSLDNFTEYRVRVNRHNNAPTWDIEEPCALSNHLNCFNAESNTVLAGEDYNMFFSVVDKDDDAITFVVPKIPRFGRLEYVSEKMGGTTRRSVKPGQQIRLSKSTTPFKGLVILIYRHVYNTAKFDQYPLRDTFTIYGSDGADKTQMMSVNLTIVNDGSRAKKKDDRKTRVRDSFAVGVAVLVMLCAIIVAAAIIVKRRQSLKRRYMALPVVTGQPQAAAGPAREMSPVAAA